MKQISTLTQSRITQTGRRRQPAPCANGSGNRKHVATLNNGKRKR